MTEEQKTGSASELDEIYSLLTYSLVYSDWQHQEIPREKRRGYNIAALLVNAEKYPVFAGLNCVNSLNDATQHGELRAITKYIDRAKCFNLDGFTVYTSLEPCIMCAGMMTMTAVDRVVFGQHDVEYSKAFERLSIDARSIGGFAPYPRQVSAGASTLDFCMRLDNLYQDFLKNDHEKILAKFLVSEEARNIYQEAHQSFLSLEIRYTGNKEFYQEALKFLNTYNYE